MTSSRLIGRAGELAELEAALADAAAARPSLAFLAGDSGVGKSRLLAGLSEHAEAHGARVLVGDCVELGDGELPYAPIVAALRSLARAGDPVLDGLQSADRAALARILPGLGDTSALNLPADATAQAQLFEALLALLDALGRESPVVLALEDLHWADRSTRSFVAFLARALCTERVLVVATYRSDEMHRRHPLRPLLAEIERDVRARRIELEPLTREEISDQLEDILGAAPERDLRERLWSRGGGNPLFTEELLAAGLDGRGAPPSTLREALMLRVERLPDAAQVLLPQLAVGQRLDHRLLAEASGLEPAELRAALREAVAGHIVVADDDGRYAFRHALLREVILDDLLPGEAAELHGVLAAAIERRLAGDGDGAHLTAAAAHHHLGAGDRPAALAACVRAAAAAERVHAHGEALALLERALELWHKVEDPEALAGGDRVEILMRAADAADANTEVARMEALVEKALREVDPETEPYRAARLLERLARAQRRLGRGQEGLDTVHRGLELLPEEPSVERARLLSTGAKFRMLHGKYERGALLAREAVEVAAAVGDPVAEVRALNALGVCEALQGDPDAGTAALRRALEIARGTGHPAHFSDAYVNLADTLLLHGRVEEARTVAEEGRALDGLSRHSAEWLDAMISEIAFESGDWATAEATLPQSRRATGTLLANLAMRRAYLALGRGDHATAREEIERATPVIERSDESQFHGSLGGAAAELERRSGDIDAARRVVDTSLDRIEYCTDDDMRVAHISSLGVAVEADAAERARDLNDIEALVDAQDRAQALLERVEAGAADGRPVEAALLAGAQADLDRVNGLVRPAGYAAAAAAWEAARRPYPAAVMRWREAQAHLAAGDRDAACNSLEVALESARSLGSDWLVAELEGLAARARLSLGGSEEAEDAPPAAPEELPFGLTPRELQVLALVARGATNREIGAELYMAEKTASVHVSRILSKLDVRSRTEAAAVAHRHGLDTERAPA